MPRNRVADGHSWQISIHMTKKHELAGNCREFLRQISRMLYEFDISCSSIGMTETANKISNNPVFWLAISSQKSIVSFYRHIGFYSEDKNNVLKSCIDDIARHGRLLSKELSLMLANLKERFGTDRMLLSKINTFSSCKYTVRQVEHFRRGESKIPLDFIFALLKINGRRLPEEVPEHVRFLYEISAPSSRQ